MTTAELGGPQIILVADDDCDLVTLMSRRLVKAGYVVITASNGAEALERAQELIPNLVVLDVMMPKLTGIEVMEQLRAGHRTHDIPIILISAGFTSDAAQRDLLGADAYVTKPFGPKELPERVDALLRAAHAQRRSAEDAVSDTENDHRPDGDHYVVVASREAADGQSPDR